MSYMGSVGSAVQREGIEGLREVTGMLRELEAERDRIIEAIDRDKTYRDHGHLTLKACIQYVTRCSADEATAMRRRTKVRGKLPKLAAAIDAGQVPDAAVQTIARVTGNPRVAHALADAEDYFVELATGFQHADLKASVTTWARGTDPDGADQDDHDAFERRGLDHDQILSGSWRTRATYDALGGAVYAEVLAAFEAAELAADQAAGVYRTPRQRRLDATVAMAKAATTCPGGPAAGKPLVSIVIDERTFRDGLLAIARGEAPAERQDTICRTRDGARLPIRSAIEAAINGSVNKVVYDERGLTINYGRTRRLFTGAAAKAVLIHYPTCYFPGCTTPASKLQVDHHDGWAGGGGTDQCNGKGACGPHNRCQEHGFRPWRRPDGTWGILRPDGTPITEPI
jgi:hypothetical protein